MDLSVLFKRAGQAAAENSPAILTAIGVTGTLATAYLAAKAAFKSVDVLKNLEEKKVDKNRDGDDLTDEERADPFRFELTTQEKFEAVWQLYVPAAASAAMTVAAIIGANHIGNRRTAALASAYSVAEKGIKEYREKVTEKIGKKKEEEIRAEVAQDQITKHPLAQTTLIVTGNGDTLCFDTWSGRYFTSSMEHIRKAENTLNNRVNNDSHASLTEFWTLLGIPSTDNSDEIGWDTDKLLDIATYAILENDKPGLAMEFRVRPEPRFMQVH